MKDIFPKRPSGRGHTAQEFAEFVPAIRERARLSSLSPKSIDQYGEGPGGWDFSDMSPEDVAAWQDLQRQRAGGGAWSP